MQKLATVRSLMIGAALAATMLSGCGQDSTSVPEPVVTTAAPQALSTEQLETVLADVEKKVEKRYSGTVGIAVANGHETAAAGETAPLQAWSSIKVPIAIAAMRNNDYWIDSMNAAISWSDNDAAINLWYSMAEPKKEVAKVLEEADGTQEDFISAVLDPAYDAFGEPLWSVPEQAQFANHLACISGSDAVIEAMGDIAEDQSYGLGTIKGAHFKGGWGPDDETGSYTARQFGLIPVDSGKDVAVAIFAQADEGYYDTEQDMLNMIARELKKIGKQLPAAECQPKDKSRVSAQTTSSSLTESTSARRN